MVSNLLEFGNNFQTFSTSLSTPTSMTPLTRENLDLSGRFLRSQVPTCLIMTIDD